MNILRVALSVFLAWVAYRHATMWGRMFMNLEGMKSPIEVSPAYLNPLSRLILFPGVQLALLAATWAVFPYGHWGLVAALISWWGHKSGMRCELLRSFVRQLLMHLEEGVPLDEAWPAANQTITALTGMQNINVDQHAGDPRALVSYVVRTTRSRGEAQDIASRWAQLGPGATASER